MTDIAQLAVEVRSGDVSRARRELDLLTASGKKTEQATQALTASSNRLGQVLGGVVAGLGVRQVLAYADSYSQVNARLGLVTNSTSELARVQSELVALSERQRVSFSAAADLYTKSASAANELGASQQDLIKFTEGVSAALTLGGTSGQQATGALLQLSQAIGGSVIQAQEFNSLIDGARPLLQAVANNLDRAGGSVSRLKQLVNDGEVSSRQFFQAGVKGSDELIAATQRIPTTFGQALTIAESRIERFIGKQAEASGAIRVLVSGVDALSKNLDTLAAAALGFGAAKLAGVILETANATRVKVGALVAEIAAQRGSLAATVQATTATVAQTEAEAAATASKVAGLQATQAAIVAARAEAISKLKVTEAAIAQSQAQIAAARSAGALSVALAAVKQGEDALAAAQARRALLVNELALLGQQQARVSTATAAATAAQTAATTALTGATAAQANAQKALAVASGAGAAAAGLAGRALGLLGGPIGAVTTLLGLGATAWALWGSSSRKETQTAAESFAQRGKDIEAGLRRQIELLDRRNRLSAGGTPVRKQGTDEQLDRLAEISRRIAEVNAQQGEFDKETGRPKVAVIQDLSREYAGLVRLIDEAGRKQAEFESGGDKEAQSKLLKKYQTDAQKLKEALDEARTAFGGVIPKDLEARITESFSTKAANPLRDEIKSLRERAALIGQDTELERINAEIKLGKFGKLAPAQAEELRRLAQVADARQKEVDAIEEARRAKDNEIAATTRAAQSQLQGLEALQEGNQTLREEIELIGANELAQAAIHKARIRSIRTLKEEQLARLEASGVAEQQLQVLQAEIEALKEREELIDQRATVVLKTKADEDSRKAGDAYRNNLSESIEDGILEGFRQGRDLTSIFLNELKAQFAKTVLRPVIQPVAEAGNQLIGALVNVVAGAISGGLSSMKYSGSSATPTAANYENSFDRGEVLASYATGTNRVPEDGLYYLHKDEAVQPARYNPAVGGAGAGSTVVNVRIENAPQGAQVSKSTNSRGETDVLIRFQEQLIGAVAGDIRSGQGPVSSALAANGMNRSAGLR